jgi:hypothetical protein
VNSISSVGSNSVPDYSSLLSALGGDSLGSGGLFSQAMSQASTPRQKAQTAFLQVEYDNLNTLYNAVSGGSDPLTGSMNDLMGLDMGSLSSQLRQLATLLGLPSNPATTGTDNPLGLTENQIMGLQAQQLLNNDLASFGTDSNPGINTLV